MKSLLLLMMVLGFTGREGDIPEDVTGDPQAINLYSQMMDTLHGAKSLAFESNFSFYSIKEGKENFRMDNTYKAWLMKPNFARLKGWKQSAHWRAVLLMILTTFS